MTTSGSSNSAAKAFYAFIFSKAGQQIWLNQHFRPTLASLVGQTKTTFYTPTSFTSIATLGGWAKVDPKFFSPTGIITKAENAHGFTS